MSDNVAAPTQPAETSGSPAEFLKNVVGKEVKVRIGQGIDYQGMLRFTLSSSSADARRISGNLSCLDGYMNVAMENTKEMVDGKVTASFGDAFIRGNNGEFLWKFFVSNLVCLYSLVPVLYISAMEDI
jgi:U6 snRNA-associated Sm-like protein LSm6